MQKIHNFFQNIGNKQQYYKKTGNVDSYLNINISSVIPSVHSLIQIKGYQNSTLNKESVINSLVKQDSLVEIVK